MAPHKPSHDRKSFQALRQRAEALLRARPADTPTKATEDVQALVHELNVHQMELEIQNEELRQAQVELSHARDRYADLYEFAPVGYVTLDTEGRILEANLTAATMLGVERQSLLRTKFSHFVARDSQDDFYLHCRAVFSSETKVTCDVEIPRADGTRLVARLESIAYGLVGERRCRTAIVDVTAARQTQHQLQKSNERYHRLTEAVTDYIFHIRVDRGRAVETVHGANCEAITGYTPQEFAANSLLWIAMVPKEERAIVQEQASRILSGQAAPPIEHRIRRKDGAVRWVLNTASPQLDEQGRLVGYDGLLRDITLRKDAEVKLKQLNEELEQRVAERTQEIRLLAEAISHLGEGVVITDDELDWPGPRIRFVNEAMCRITGYAADELIGKTPRVLQGSATDREALDRLKAELSAGRACLVEVTNYRKDGTPYDAELFVTPLFDADGRRTNFVSVHRDVTRRKRAESLLRQERNRAQQYLDVAGVVMVALDAEGVIRLINRKGCEMLGYHEDEIIGKNWFDVCLPERLRDDIRTVFRQIMSGTLAAVEYFENPVLTKTGEERIIEWHNAELRDETGSVVGVLGSGTDITERLRAEQALQERKERLRAVLNTAADAIITIDRRGVIDNVNAATERLFGFTRDELVGQNVKILMPPPYHDEHDGYLARYLATGEARIIGSGREVVGRRKDGSTFPVDLAVSEIDHLGLFTGIIRDISDRKELQRQVLEIAAEEDRWIGHELHEGIQQEITAMELVAGTLRDALDAADQREIEGMAARILAERDFLRSREIADKLCKGLAGTHAHVQQLSRGIMPVQVDAQGLNSALAELAASTSMLQDFECRFESPEVVEVADNTTATHLYRIAQEAVNNALRHSQGSEIRISLVRQDHQLVLEVSDNGVGIDAGFSSRAGAPLGSTGIGLRAMHYRAGLIGATLDIRQREGGGTQVTCTILEG